MSLNAKQARFAKEYLLDLNATQAAIRAGYSAKTAYSQGQRLLKHVEVERLIKDRYGKLETKLDCSLERLFLELSRMGLYDPRKFYDAQGNLKPVPELDDDTAAALAGMDVEEAYEHFAKGQAKATGVIKKLKFCDKNRAIENLLKYKHRIGEKLEVTGLEGLADKLAQIRKAKLARRTG